MLNTWVTKRGLFVPRRPHAAPVVSQHMPSTQRPSPTVPIAGAAALDLSSSFMCEIEDCIFPATPQRPGDSGQAASRAFPLTWLCQP
jgi:hypothetical protein